MGFLRPEWLLLAVPLGWLLVATGRAQHVITNVLRALGAAALVLAIAGPYLRAGTDTRHVVFLVDRSRSMPAGAEAEAIELIDLGLRQRSGQDEVHVVGFAEGAHIERTLGAGARGFGGFESEIGLDGSDLASGLESAISMIPKDARGSIVLLSDGEVENVSAVESAVLAASARGIRIDVRELGRERLEDTAIERVELPGEVDAAEPFFVTAWIRSDLRQVRTVRLVREGVVVSAQRLELEPGRTRVRFRERLDRAGIGRYAVELAPEEGASPGERDRIPENDRAIAATRAIGARPVLIVNHDGAVDTLTAALQAAGVPAVPVAPESAPTSVVGLDRFRAVVLENVSAARLGLVRMEALRTWTVDHGGGLLLTGGLASFGSGGYFRSPLDEVLPVSMELRQEHRKLAVALSVTLDRSGSMGAAVAGGGTKMDLANAGTVEALKLLSPNDSASVIAVDSAAHVIQPQEDLVDLQSVITRVRGIRSQGGGIFTAVALRESARELQRADQATKHVILFADAADAEQYDETPAEIQLLRDMGATVSVIALGTDTDPDAGFLRRCAAQGGGEIYFTQSATELPRLFAMDTQSVARSTFVEELTGVKSRPELFGLGEIQSAAFPDLGGYNLTYLRPGASLGAVTTDEFAAPIFAFHPRGLGRAAAFTAQIGGTTGASLEGWSGFSAFFVTVTRWLSGIEAPAGVFASIERDGRDAVLSVELDPDFDTSALGESLTATVSTEDGAASTVTLTRTSDTRFEGRHALRQGQIAMTTVSFDGGGGPTAVPMAPVALPYSPEYEHPTDLRAGERLLRLAAARTGGVTNMAASDVFRGERGTRSWTLISRQLALLALLLLVAEIAGRRLSLWDDLRRPRVPRALGALATLGALRRARAAEAAAGTGSPSTRPTRTAAPGDDAAPSPAPSPAPAPAPAEAPAERAPDLADALTRARRAAGGRFDRS